MKLFSFYWVQYIKSAKCDQIFFFLFACIHNYIHSVRLLSNQRLWNWVIEFLHRKNRLNFFSYFLRQWKRISRLPLYLFRSMVFDISVSSYRTIEHCSFTKSEWFTKNNRKKHCSRKSMDIFNFMFIFTFFEVCKRFLWLMQKENIIWIFIFDSFS